MSENLETNVQEHAPSPAAACSDPQPASERPDQPDNKAAGEGRVARLVRCSSSSVETLDARVESSNLRSSGASLQSRILLNKIRILRLKLLQFRLDFRYSLFLLRADGLKFFPATFAALLEAIRLYLGRHLGYDVVNVFQSTHSVESVKIESHV